MRVAALCAALLVLLPLGRAVAGETCPEVPDEEAALRRSMAKEWFAKAEEAEAAGDRQTAVNRYACSLKLAPHPSTAYNLGTAAEKSGDLSMAVDAFRMYLNLATEAGDRSAVEARVARLEAKITELRQQLEAKPAQPSAATATAPHAASARSGPPAADTAPAEVAARKSGGEPAHAYRVGGWVALGGGVAALGTGVAFNIIARNKMDDCRALVAKGAQGALDQCDAAKPFAYGSYGLFGVAGALAVTGVTLLLWKVEDGTAVSFAPTSGGGALIASGRF
jgi:hypothetical protein